jgi:putative transposase
MSAAEWDRLQPYVEVHATIGAPRPVGLGGGVTALFYLNRTGCQWDMVPRELPAYSSVSWYFQTWSKAGTWKRMNDELPRQGRRDAKQEPAPRAVLVDSPSVNRSRWNGGA